MTQAASPELQPGHVYRTRDLQRWGANPTRLAKRLVSDGQLVPLARGLFAHPRVSRFGPVPPADEELMRAFLDGTPFVFTGPDKWNALGLGTTAVAATTLVYNRKRSGTFRLGRRLFNLRRVEFPEAPTREWYAVDLLQHAAQAAASASDLGGALVFALARGDFQREELQRMAQRYGSKRTQAIVGHALAAAVA
jgi:hypothetical protein